MRLYLIVALTAFCLLMQAYLGPRPGANDGGYGFHRTGKTGKRDATTTEKEEKAKAEQPYTIEPVVVTATRTETPLSEVTKSVDVVDKKDMETQQQTSIPEAVQHCTRRYGPEPGRAWTILRLSIFVGPAVSMSNSNIMVSP